MKPRTHVSVDTVSAFRELHIAGPNQYRSAGVCAKLASAHVTTKTIDKELSHLKRLWC